MREEWSVAPIYLRQIAKALATFGIFYDILVAVNIVLNWKKEIYQKTSGAEGISRFYGRSYRRGPS
jgi:hypothetical protein